MLSCLMQVVFTTACGAEDVQWSWGLEKPDHNIAAGLMEHEKGQWPGCRPRNGEAWTVVPDGLPLKT